MKLLGAYASDESLGLTIVFSSKETRELTSLD